MAIVLATAPVALAAGKLKVTSVADYRKCADGYEAGPEACLDALKVFVKAHPDQAFAAGKAVRGTSTHWVAIPFFATALGKKVDKVRCADEDLTLALTSALALPAREEAALTAARTILFDKCWDVTQAAVLKELTQSGSSGYMAENLCPTLIARKVSNPSCEKAPPVAAVVQEFKWKEIDPKTLSVDGPAKVYKGAEGSKLVLVKLKNQPDAYLVGFEGFRGPSAGRVALHREAPAGTGYDYFTQVNGARWVSVVMRDGTCEAHPPGDKGTFRLAYDEAASKATNPQVVLEQFTKQKK